MPRTYGERVVLNALFPIVCPISVKLKDSVIKARDGTGPLIDGGVNAYQQLTDFDLSSDDTVRIIPIIVPIRRTFWRLSYLLSSLRLRSIAGEPLLLDTRASNYQGEEKVSVYKGRLKLSWKKGQRLFTPRFESSDVSDVKLILRFRVDNAHDSLDCFDATDPNDNNQLICADLSGILENPILGYLKFLMVNAKSNNPVRWTDPADFPVRKSKLIVCWGESIP